MVFNILLLLGGVWLLLSGSHIFAAIIITLSILNIIVEIFE